ncbi:unnamed protein product, partial [Bubo scandiacus]
MDGASPNSSGPPPGAGGAPRGRRDADLRGPSHHPLPQRQRGFLQPRAGLQPRPDV